jgi:S1-C subfamily serine protease
MFVEELTPQLARNFGLSEKSGLVVVRVVANSPAEEAGIMPGDFILEVDQITVKDLEEFYDKIQDYKEGDTILFLVKRDDATIYLTLKVEK